MECARWAALPLVCWTLVGADPPKDTARRLASALTASTPLLTDLQELCDGIGGRPTGSPACNRAIDWGLAKFRAIGMDHMAAEEFSIPHRWTPVAAEALVLTPISLALRIAAAPSTPSTPGGRPIEARLALAGEGSAADFSKLGAKARGAIVLVRGPEIHTLDDLFGEYMKNGALVEQARKAGVAAVLWEASHTSGLLYRHPMTFTGDLAPVPVAVLAREQAERLARLAQREEVRVRLQLRNETEGTTASRNVIAEIKGREKPDEIVLLGAHLDSWDLGTGAEDNGINVALVIDVARAIKRLGLRPRRTLRFALWTGEEQGMWGSAAYVIAHAAELEQHVATITFDIGSGKTLGFYLNGREELRRPVTAALAAAGLSATTHLPDAVDGTDNYDFLLSGVPNLVANQDASNYVPSYHAESDTPERVNAKEARQNTAIAAALVWGLAESPERIAPRQSKAQIDKLMKDAKLDEQMKVFGQWADWQAGRRGRPRP
jgi:carboxypeptidase Q